MAEQALGRGRRRRSLRCARARLGAATWRIVTDLLEATRGTFTRVIVNDRLDVALACGAAGVHLRGDSIAVADARRLAPGGFLIGRSVRGVDEAVGSAGADYLVAGTVFPTDSKAGSAAWLGADGLRAIVRAVRTPVLAIGGVTERTVGDVAAAGAAGFAAIGLFLGPDADGPGGLRVPCRAIPLRAIVERVRSSFDSVQTAP